MKEGTLLDLVCKNGMRLNYRRAKFLLLELVSCVHVCKLLSILFLKIL